MVYPQEVEVATGHGGVACTVASLAGKELVHPAGTVVGGVAFQESALVRVGLIMVDGIYLNVLVRDLGSFSRVETWQYVFGNEL